MRQSLIATVTAMMLAFGGAAEAATVTDPTGDFIATYTGPHQADLDVTSFTVAYNSAAQAFLLQSTMAGIINPALGGFYAIGVDTGTGPNNFASIGLAGVKFNSVIAVRKDGTANIGANALAPGSVTIGGNALSVMVPLSLLPSTGFDPLHYGFNIWPRSSTTPGTAVISDFAPNNGILSTIGVTAAAPEPATWMSMLIGFALCGTALRSSRRRALPAL